MALEKLTDIKGVPLRGGAITVREKPLLPLGAFSMVQNLRGKHPGFKKRKGQRVQHTTADGSNKVESLYQMDKGKRSEKHFFAQMSDGDILEATTAPDGTTTGAFGSEVHDGTATGMIPAAWSVGDDILIYSNGSDQHQIYAGTDNHIIAFIKYDSADTAPPIIPTEDGTDYTTELTDGLTSTVAVLDSLDTLANYNCLFICTPIPANRLTWAISLPNGTGAVGTLSYRKNDNTWADTSETDGTILSSKTLGKSGSMTWTHPDDEIPCYMYGRNGFWYRWETATQIDSEVEVTSLTYGSAFQDIVNVWNGAIPYAVEARFYDQSATVFNTNRQETLNLPSPTPIVWHTIVSRGLPAP